MQIAVERPAYRFGYLVFLLILLELASAATCTTCIDGSPITRPDKVLDIEGIVVKDCTTLDGLASTTETGSILCDAFQAVGTVCGCPIPEGGCNLCQDGTTVSNPTVILDDYPLIEFILGVPPNSLATCEALEAVMHQKPEDGALCAETQLNTYEGCGCVKPQITANITNGTEITESPRQTKEPQEICTVCPDGAPMQFPDKPLFLSETIDVSVCGDLDRVAGFLSTGSAECIGIRTISTFCGCTVRVNDCSFCPKGQSVPNPDIYLDWFSDVILNVPLAYRMLEESLTCGIYEALLFNIADSTLGVDPELLCLAGQLKSGICGCEHDWHAILLVWSYRAAGMLSLLGSGYILFDILSTASKRRSTYHQLVMGISFHDCVSSLAYSLATVMVPVETGLYGALGTDMTCKLQGFMIQWGYTSVFYNVLLSVYFFLMVNYNWKEERFRRWRQYWHAAVCVSGLALAIGGYAFYDAQLAICYVVPPPLTATWIPLSVFYTMPVSVSLLIVVGTTGAICRRVYTQEKASMKWRVRKDWKLSKKVFWQSFWYVLSFLVTLPLLLVSYFLEFKSKSSYWLFAIAGILAPSQGILNFFVYLHRDSKIKKIFRCLTLGVLKLVRYSRSSSSDHPPASGPGTGNPTIPAEKVGSKVSQRIPVESKKASSALEEWASSHLSEAEKRFSLERGSRYLGEEGDNGREDHIDEHTSDDLSMDEEEIFAGVREYWEVIDKLNRQTSDVGVTNHRENNGSLSERLARSFNFLRAFDERDEEEDDDSADESKKRRSNSGGRLRTFNIRFAKPACAVTRQIETDHSRRGPSDLMRRSYHGVTEHQSGLIPVKDGQAVRDDYDVSSTHSLG